MTVTLTASLNDTGSLAVRSGDSMIDHQRDGDQVTFQLTPAANLTTLWSALPQRH